MSKVIVRDRKITLLLGVMVSIIFGIFTYYSVEERFRDQEMVMLLVCSAVFGSGMLFGVYLLWGYFRRRLVFDGHTVTYIPAAGRKRVFSCSEIAKLQMIVGSGVLRYQILDRDGKVLALFGNYMENCDRAVHFLVQSGIQVDTMQKRVPKKRESGIDRTVTKGKRREAEYIKKRYKPAQIERERCFVRLMSRVLFYFTVTAILLPERMRLFVYILILWIIWGVYLALYPRMTMEPSVVKGVSTYYVTMPRAVCAVSVLALFFMTRTLNTSDNAIYFKFLLLYTGRLGTFVPPSICRR